NAESGAFEVRSLPLDELTSLASQPGSPASWQPLALAAEDFDADGVVDVVSAWDAGDAGALILQRGLAARAERAAQAAGNARRFFTGRAESTPLAFAADLLVAGDFDADGRADLVAAASGGHELVLLRGDGHGGFRAARRRELFGALTALAAADVNRR